MPQVFTDLCEGDCATQPFHEDFASNPESRWGLRFRDNCNLESCVDGLVINPEPTDYWFHDANHDARAPMLHRRLCGSFAMVASVQVAGAPLAHNGAGLVVVHPGDDTRWVLLSHGFQDAAVLGSKVWPNGPSFTDGQAETLVAVNTGVVLSACRLASGEIYFHRFEPDDAGVMRVRPHPSQDEHYRLDDSCCLDVGLTGHMFTADGSTPHHLFHWVEITGDVQTIEDCAAFVDQARSLHP